MLEVAHLVKTFAATRAEKAKRVFAVDDVSFRVEQGELFTLLGPSGCGKTTTLRCIAGLEAADRGEIVLADRVLFSSERKVRVPASERGLGMVFQSYAIWPHMDVYSNVAFPLQVLPRRRRPDGSEVRRRVERALATVKLDHLASRRATDLSGGQQQRLALARALVLEPPLLLLDEPLSNLDAKLREEMRFELKRLQRDLGITAVYVTHDQVEALAMSNRVAVMRDGVIQQVGRPRDVYESPRSRFVADFIGISNFVDGKISARENSLYTVATAEGDLRVKSDADFPIGTGVLVAVRPEHVRLEVGQANGRAPNRWSGRVAARAFLGESVDHLVTVGSCEIRARCDASVSIPEPTEVTVTFEQEACSLIPAE